MVFIYIIIFHTLLAVIRPEDNSPGGFALVFGMPFPNPGAQGPESSCSIRAAGAWVQWGSSMGMSLSFRVLDIWDPG